VNARPHPGTDRLRWLGHSTVLIELGGVRLLTDPLLRTRVLHLRRSPPLDLDGLAELDAVLVSHVHYDHLDLPSLRRLGRRTTIVAPRGAGRLLGRRGFTSVVELSAGEEIRVGPLVVQAVRAEHDARRLGARAESLGYAVAGSKRLYFSGDTALFQGMADLASPTDVALLPIWGWGPSLGPGHLDPRSAAEALTLIRPEIAVPIHWGTYYPLTSALRSPPAYLSAPAEAFAHAAAELAPDVAVQILRVGGTLPLAGE
jgi:L-ascorbate metabolism protein UlaG (beta-lactamase superfamily)